MKNFIVTVAGESREITATHMYGDKYVSDRIFVARIGHAAKLHEVKMYFISTSDDPKEYQTLNTIVLNKPARIVGWLDRQIDKSLSKHIMESSNRK